MISLKALQQLSLSQIDLLRNTSENECPSVEVELPLLPYTQFLLRLYQAFDIFW